MLELSKTPTTKAGKPAGSALLDEAKMLIALSGVFPSLEAAFQDRSSPKHRRACVEIIRTAKDDASAYSLAELLDVGNTSAFFQKLEGCFALKPRSADAPSAMTTAQMLASLGIQTPDTDEAPEAD